MEPTWGSTLSLDPIKVSPPGLMYGATKSGANLVGVTAPQAVTVTAASAATTWTATTNDSWLQLTNGSGTGSGQFSVAVANPGNVIGGRTWLEGTITVVAAGAEGQPILVPGDADGRSDRWRDDGAAVRAGGHAAAGRDGRRGHDRRDGLGGG